MRGGPPPPAAKRESLGDRAADDLRFIRLAMERSSAFTAVPGAGAIAIGVVGLAAALAGSRQDSPDRWLAVWVAAAVLAFAIGLAAISRKAARNNTVLTGALARNFAVAMMSPLVAGAGVTYALWSAGAHAAMPAAWLLMYGAGVITGGMFSVRVVRLTGVALMALGFVAAFTPASWGNAWLGAGFGFVHIASGINIKRNHGG